MQGMEPVAIVTILIVLQFFMFAMFVGRARATQNIQPPAVTGDELFERYFRVHQNSLEQLPITLPALWLYAWYVDPLSASAAGVVFMIGRQVYFSSYIKDPAKRAPGFIIGNLAQIVLIVGAIIGAVLSWQNS